MKIALNWRGPFDLEKLSDDEICEESAVYAWVYKKGPYKKEGIYFGAATNLKLRIWTHFEKILAGHYYIPNKNATSMQDFDYKPINKLTEFKNKERLRRHIEHIFEVEIFYALAPAPHIFGIERVLIEHFRKNLNQERYFVANKGLRGCKECKESFSFTNKAPDRIISLLKPTMYYSYKE